MQGHPHLLKKCYANKMQYTYYTSCNNSGILQHPTLNNGQVIETETKQRLSETKRCYKPNVLNRYLKNILP